MDEGVSAPAALAVYRRDQDVPPWTGLPTAGCHRALVRRVVGRRPDAQLVTYNRSAYRRWLGSRPDSEELRTAWAINRVETAPLFKAENVLVGIRHEKEGKLRVTYTGWDARLSPFRARWLRGCSP